MRGSHETRTDSVSEGMNETATSAPDWAAGSSRLDEGMIGGGVLWLSGSAAESVWSWRAP